MVLFITNIPLTKFESVNEISQSAVVTHVQMKPPSWSNYYVVVHGVFIISILEEETSYEFVSISS